MVAFSACRRGWWKYPRTWQYSKQRRWSLWRSWRQQLNTEFVSPSCWQQMSQNLTKPTKWHMRPAKTHFSLGIRPVWSGSMLSTWRNTLRYPHGETLGHYLPIESTVKALIRLCGCPGWSESSLGRTCHFVCFVMLRLKCLLCMTSRARENRNFFGPGPKFRNWDRLKTAKSPKKSVPYWPNT